MPNNIKTEIYNEISDFLSAFKCDNTLLLKQKYDLPQELFDEMNELVLSDFTSDKQDLNLFPISDMDLDAGGKKLLSLNYASQNNVYIVECDILLNNEYCGLCLIADYHPADHYPKLEFKYFRF